MASLRRMAPIFNVHELDAAMAHYRKLGFATRRAEGFASAYATRDGLEDRTILATCGLMNPGKGIQHAIDALALLVEEFPDVLYLVVGETDRS